MTTLAAAVVAPGRDYDELATTLGPLARALPVHLPIDPSTTLTNLVAAVAAHQSAARAAQHCFAWPNATGVPFGFDFASAPLSHQAADVTFAAVEIFAPVDHFLLTMHVRVAADKGPGKGLRLGLAHDGRLPPVVIEALAVSLQALLGDAARNPHKAIGDLKLRDSPDPLIDLPAPRSSPSTAPGSAELRDREATSVSGETVTQRIAEWAKEDPEGPALTAGETRWSRRQLSARVGKIAAALRARGIGPERRVALCFDRSATAVAAMLGVIEAGGAYVFLDPQLPASRLAFMLTRSAADLLLTAPDLPSNLISWEGPTMTLAGLESVTAELAADEESSATTRSENLAYLVFTSGSSGEPKAVGVSHGHLLAYVDGLIEGLGLEPRSTFATVTTLAADLGHTAVFGALMSGGCLHLVAPEVAADATALGAYIESNEIDLLKVVPSHLRALLKSGATPVPLPRRWLVLGGEACDWPLIETARARSTCQIFNHYGPTETTVGVLAGEIPTVPLRSGSSAAGVPLGKPLAGRRAYLLDANLEPVPDGMAGELMLGGSGVARGYLSDAAATAARFLPDPHAASPGARLYRTGDRARRCIENSSRTDKELPLVFLGRIDQQLKIRGFRVEPAEIEARLAEQPSIVQAVVVPERSSADAEPRLVAYLLLDSGPSPRVEALRRGLAQTLPEYMIPSLYVILDTLPRTANGKIDRRALPAPEDARLLATAAYAPPVTEIEQRIASLWRDALKHDHVGIDDNFFDLGGHSLLLMQVAADLQRDLNREISVVELFARPTVGALAAFLGESQAAARSGAEAGKTTDAVPMIHAEKQGRDRRSRLAKQRRRREETVDTTGDQG